MPYFSFIWLSRHCIEWLIYYIFLLHPVCCSDWFSWVQAIAMMQRTIISTLTLAPSHLCLSRLCSGLLSQWCSPSPLRGPCSWENMLLEHVSYNMRLSYAMCDVHDCIVVVLQCHALQKNACIVERCCHAVQLMAARQEYYLQSSLCIQRNDLTIGPEPTISSFFATFNCTSSVHALP